MAMTQTESKFSSMRTELLPWVEKYRPKDLAEIHGHTEIISTIQRLLDREELPHLLFYGPPGTGKTTTVLALARNLFTQHYSSMVLELNASDDRGIDVIRDKIKTFASSKVIFSNNFKLVVLDEADAMTSAAQFALRRVMEKYTKNARFCLICNYVQNIIPALQSRCMKFRFRPLEEQFLTQTITKVAELEQLQLSDTGRTALLQLSGGDMRRVLNLMQSSSMASSIISENAIYHAAGAPLPRDIEECFNVCMNSDFSSSVSALQQLMENKGIALIDIITGFHHMVVRINIPDQVKSQWPQPVIAMAVVAIVSSRLND